ncbi:putative mitochondrial hypothetical protein [Leptomonas pyrrhocoris]|uniref:Uncharacterized protein n=1 Tax=Leptomonas pyrrhocoris TaxID=157538 RepID=A0A0N0DXY7_LEPPY|nr:putative mitochondrial hypothetical protein [Leptomonas pyrrhocoris]KPA83491.1 putative mitochondrial hypothetical protein [Leptomonas pyrrhocoris]|eukprot:XP_015661930.1 putative mitochondrial hypothetical protein [Leptomonas pyrrhocoris]
MGALLSSLLFPRKRCRDNGGGGGEDIATVSREPRSPRACGGGAPANMVDPSPSLLAKHLCRLRYRCTSSEKVGSLVCRHVAEDATTRQTYGCHAHLYETVTAEESHGVALAWCVDEADPISALSLLSLCRVANSCRKTTLLTSPLGDALILTYTATL